MREFRVNKFLTLRLEEGKTVIYVDNKRFTQCKYLLLQIPSEYINDLDEVDSIDEAVEKLSHVLEENDDSERRTNIDPETEFWAHCSNVQAWCENEYDTRLLHSNLSFPLLKELTEVGDPLARKVFKEEIALRLESGYPSVIIFLIAEKYIAYLERKDFLLSILNEKDAFIILEIEKSLKIKLSVEYEDLDFCDKSAFAFRNKKVLGLQLFDLEVNLPFKYITNLEYLYSLSLNGCNLTKLPRSIENLKNLTILDLSDNKLEFIPREIKKLLNLQEVYLCGNHISNIQNIVEIIENLERLRDLDLSYNKIKTFPNNLEQINSSLNYLDLSYNKIKTFPNNLEQIKLDRNLTIYIFKKKRSLLSGL